MFELVIACAPFETTAVSIGVVFPPYQEHRYCPVKNSRGRRTQYLLQHEKPFPALVVDPSTFYRVFTNEVTFSFEWPALLRRYDDNVTVRKVSRENEDADTGDIPWDLLDEWDSTEYVSGILPEYKREHLSSAIAFPNVTKEELPTCWHEQGMTLLWNDHFVPKDHPARVHIGEGPFLVLRDESYLLAFTRDPNSKERIKNVKAGGNRLVLESMSTHSLTIAHGGYFVMANTAKVLKYPSKTDEVKIVTNEDYLNIDAHVRVA